MPSFNSHRWTPDVYVSFIADDVRNFTHLLFRWLESAGIGYFKDYTKEDKLHQGIRQARFALVVFSENYASCNHRLDELVNILRKGHSEYPSLVVIPIFHGIIPAKVLNLQIKGEAEKALKKLHRSERNEKETGWKRALEKIEGIPGYDLQKDANGDNSKLIKKIADRLFNEIWSLYSSKVFGPFGSGEISWRYHAKNLTHNQYEEFVQYVHYEVNGRNSGKVKLEKDKRINSFSGYLENKDDGSIRVNALAFGTTPEKYLKPIGERQEGSFSVSLPPDAGIEFFGSKIRDGFVTSIGARVELTPVELPSGVSRPVGLFGSRRGTKWDDKQHTTVKGIDAVPNSSGNRCIQSIAFLYEEAWTLHGRNGKWSYPLMMENGAEYLSSISGYCNYDGITSLTFITNKKKTITIGEGKGTHFSSPTTGYKIVGFYGWSDEHFLHGIGAYYKPILDLQPIESIGPFGGGIAWDDGIFKEVKEISIYEDVDSIRNIKIEYVDNSGHIRPIVHGNDTGELYGKKIMVDLKYPKEYLKSISGSTRDDGSIESLTFHTNRKTITTGKHEGGKYFGYPSNESKIIGFYGTWGKTLNSIGVYTEPISAAKPFVCAPFEGFGGEEWEEEKYSNVVGYRVTRVGKEEKLGIQSITFMYENNGSLVEGSRHGGGDPSSGEWKMLNFPEERLLGIKGYHTRLDSDETIIHDLQIFVTGRKTAIPFASRGDPETKDRKIKKSVEKLFAGSTDFFIPDFANKDRRIVGFSGRAGKYLNSIKALLEP